MTPEDLKKLQAPLKEKYKQKSESAFLTLKAEGIISDKIGCQLTSRKLSKQAELHPYAGGNGDALCPAEIMLESLVGCAGVTMTAVATAFGIKINKGKIYAEGDMDFRGTLGIDKSVPVGFTEIRLKFEIDSDANPELLDKLYKLTERYCVVFQTLAHPPTIKVLS